MGDLFSAPETGSYIIDRREPVDTSYVECLYYTPQALKAIVEISIRKGPLSRRVTAGWFTDKNIIWSLDLGEDTGSSCNVLLVDSGQ